MGVTIIGPRAETIPKPVGPPVLSFRKNWSDAWQTDPTARLLAANLATAGQDLDQAILQTRYGTIKQPWQSAFGTVPARDLTHWWVRVQLPTQAGLVTQWVGRISGHGREAWGASTGPSGLQTWTAHGPLRILQKTTIDSSFWADPADAAKVVEIGWVPDLNDRDRLGTTAANRTAAKIGDSYAYGDAEKWTAYDALEYILDRFVDEADEDGPAWSIGGQAELLRNLTEPVAMGAAQTAADVIRALIPARYGMDYRIAPTADGFAVEVFTLCALEIGFNGQTLPKNPNTVRLAISQTHDCVRAVLASTNEHAYGRVRVIGKRIVVCATLRGFRAPGRDLDTADLVAQWDTAALEPAYLAGLAGATDPHDHDVFRAEERFKPVYQIFAAPADWDHAGGSAAPKLDANGSILPAEKATYQNLVRATLPWVPLLAGFDRTTHPATDRNPAGHTPDLLPPQAWIAHYNPDGTTLGLDERDANPPKYQTVDELGIGLQPLRNALGIQLSATPNHLVARETWRMTSPAPTEKPPLYEWSTLCATIAWESDHRLALEVEIPGAKPSDGTLAVEVPDAEYWYVAPDTVVAVDPTDPMKLVTMGPSVERDDSQRLALVMAGILARYFTSRNRAEIHVKGLIPWAGLLGHIMTLVDEGGTLHQIQAPITSVSWSIPDGDQSPVTIIRTGFAL